MKTPDQILALYIDRKAAAQGYLTVGNLIRQVYNGEHNVMLPELDANERVAVSNKVLTGIDQHAMRIASTTPTIDCPPFKTGAAALDRAYNRRNTLQAWWYLNNMDRLRRRRARHLIGYASSPVFVRPGPDGYPIWELRDPLSSFPAPSAPDDLTPPDCIFNFKRTLRWLNMYYPDHTPRLTRRDNWGWDDNIDIVQYVDDTELTMIAIGQLTPEGDSNLVSLNSTPNLAGCPLVIVPTRITLDRPQGQFDQMIGMYETEAKLWALHLHAVQRGIFGEAWAMGDNVEIITQADPYDGTIGQITGGEIKEFRLDPGFQQLNSIDRLEAAQRQVGAVPAEFGGEGSGNVRTGRRGQQVLGAAVDMPIQEHQDILAASHQAENYAAIKVAKGYWGNTTKTYHIPFLRAPVTYTPNDTFDTEAQFVRYAYSGTDTNGLVIEGGQRIGMGTLSARSFMDMDPLIHDPEAEADRIIVEGIQKAFLSSIQTQAADPNSPYTPDDLAYLYEQVYDKNVALYKAVQKLQTKKQAEQAQAAQGALPPEAMQPGLAQAGAPGTPGQATPAIAAPSPSMANLTQSLRDLRNPQRTTPAENAQVAG